jgi:hypothetical protein
MIMQQRACLMALRLSASILAVSAAGCHAQMPSAPAPLSAPVSAADQSQIGQAAQGFIAALQAHDVPKAELLMTPTFRGQVPAARLKALLAGPDQPFCTARNLQSDPVQIFSHSKNAVLRVRFSSSEGKFYRANILLTKMGDKWQVSNLFSPVARQTIQRTQQSHAQKP